jgi:hypothetical protein
MIQNRTLAANQHFVHLCMTAPDENVKRLTLDLQKSRWKAVNALADQLRDKLFNDPALRAKTQVERRVIATKQRIELNLFGTEQALKGVVKLIKTSATAQGVHMDTSLDLS